MKREFSSAQAKSVVNQHSNILNDLYNIIKAEANSVTSINDSCYALLASEVNSLLSQTSVEELSKYKKGIRVKSLINEGYTSILDIYNSTIPKLASIYGISEDGARTIKGISTVIYNKAKSETKIKLSADNKSKEATELIFKVYNYKALKTLVSPANSLIIKNERKIKGLIERAKPATSGFKWFFSFGGKKKDAILAYNDLDSLLSSEYFKTASELSDAFHFFKNASEGEAWADFVKSPYDYFTIIEKIAPSLLGNSDLVYGLDTSIVSEIENEELLLDGLNCTLRRYQEWGVKYILNQKRVLLGDEMGLGKTVQAIASMVCLRNQGATHFMVVCPASVLSNWVREITKHSDLQAIKIHSNKKDTALSRWLSEGGACVTTYETLASLNIPEDFNISILIVDEAHYIKNPDAKRTKNTVNISRHSERILFMTGTALENKVEEMLWLISILKPNVAKESSKIAFMSTSNQFREKIASVYYRRKREDVLTELPDLIENKCWCEMNEEEERVYENAIISGNYQESRRVSFSVDNLALSSKADRLIEIIKEAKEEGRKILVFSFFLDTVRKVCSLLDEECYGPINGSISPERRQEIIDEFEKAPSGSVLVSQITSGGTGLNIQAASVVVICEPQFKPSIENQAISRSYRMGQTRNVLVYRLLCENSIDERITELLESKQRIFDAFADKSVAYENEPQIDESTFGSIINDELERINKKRVTESQQDMS